MNKLSFNGKRVVVGIALVPPLFCLVNYFFDLHVFGRFDVKALIVSFIILAIVINYFGPTLHEVQEYRNAKRAMRKH